MDEYMFSTMLNHMEKLRKKLQACNSRSFCAPEAQVPPPAASASDFEWGQRHRVSEGSTFRCLALHRPFACLVPAIWAAVLRHGLILTMVFYMFVWAMAMRCCPCGTQTSWGPRGAGYADCAYPRVRGCAESPLVETSRDHRGQFSGNPPSPDHYVNPSPFCRGAHPR